MPGNWHVLVLRGGQRTNALGLPGGSRTLIGALAESPPGGCFRSKAAISLGASRLPLRPGPLARSCGNRTSRARARQPTCSGRSFPACRAREGRRRGAQDVRANTRAGQDQIRSCTGTTADLWAHESVIYAVRVSPGRSGARSGCDRVFVEPSSTDGVGDAGIGSTAGERKGGDGGELAQAAESALSQLGKRGADDDERRLQQIRCLYQREQRSVGSEVGDPPAVSAEREPEADQPEIVLISGNAGEQCAGTATTPPAARQGEQTAAQERAGEVLLRDRYLSVRPALAELVEVGKDRVPQDALERVGTQEPVE